MHSGSSSFPFPFPFMKGDGGRRFFEGDQGGSSSRDRLPRIEEGWLWLVEWRELGDEIPMVM